MIPTKPFDTYSWRWLSVAPSEGLLEAPVFLGVLRALLACEGQAFASPQLHDLLRVVEEETQSTVTLARDTGRNLLRNSGQYWRGTGLLTSKPGEIDLTPFGTRVAKGGITQAEFAALMVQQTALPNRTTYRRSEVAKWEAADLEIRPLELILEILVSMNQRHGGVPAAYMTKKELVDIVIPLSGAKADAITISDNISAYRGGALDISGWPNCAPGANDQRLAREFLLFLANFGLLRLASDSSWSDERFYLDEVFDVAAVVGPVEFSIFDPAVADKAINQVFQSELPSIVQRQRILTSVLDRSGQAAFRTRTLSAYGTRCFLTGETIPEVLEAAHILPVKNDGADHEDNSLCLRVDIHRLFDSGNLRIRPDGAVMMSEAMAKSANYASLPKTVTFRPFLKAANIEWRDKYL